jgi:mono/diheme cytochrome c family protein
MATAAFVLFWVILGLAVVLGAMRSGSRGPLLDPRKRGARRTLYVLAGLAIAVFGIGIPVLAGVLGGSNAKAGPSGIELTAQEERGRELFSQGCAQCHDLDASAAVGRVGPDLDVLRPPKDLVVNAIEQGRARGQGQMPSQLFEGEEAEDVAAYVERVAGRGSNE